MDFSSWSNSKHNYIILFIYYVTVYMCIITISNTCIFCYSFLVVVLLMKYLLKTDTICSYNNNVFSLHTHVVETCRFEDHGISVVCFVVYLFFYCGKHSFY